MWDPVTYAVYADERSRPFIELISRVGAVEPDYVVDAGCGSGELTVELANRWPRATVEGYDSSPAMITKARGLESRVRFAVADVATWRPDRPMDVIVSNAVLQWVPEHREVLEHWVEDLAPGGWLAFQVPGNFSAPSHVAIRELCASRAWSDRLDGVLRAHPVDDPIDYLDLLNHGGSQVDAWETTYMHVLQARTRCSTGSPAPPCARSSTGSTRTSSGGSSRTSPRRSPRRTRPGAMGPPSRSGGSSW